MRAVLGALASLKLTIVCLASLMIVVAACTVAQVRLGNYESVRRFIRSPFIYWDRWPLFPGGSTLGLVLLVNLLAAQWTRFELNARKAGLWLVHLGLIALFAGEFVSSLTRVEAMMVLPEGASRGYVESAHEAELVAVGGRGRSAWELALPQSKWSGAELADARLPFRLRVEESGSTGGADDDAPIWARARLSYPDGSSETRELVTGGGEQTPASGGAAEPGRAGRSPSSGNASEGGDGPVRLSLRARRFALGYALTLKRFGHEVYPGTDIPKSFSSLVEIDNPAAGERREALISMNKPLRYEGRTFYQASFGMGGTVSVLQVVENPGWAVPYVSCVLVAIGLLAHFLQRARRVPEGKV